MPCDKCGDGTRCEGRAKRLSARVELYGPLRWVKVRKRVSRDDPGPGGRDCSEIVPGDFSHTGSSGKEGRRNSMGEGREAVLLWLDTH